MENYQPPKEVVQARGDIFEMKVTDAEQCPCKEENGRRGVDVLGVSRRCFVSVNHAEPRDVERGEREIESAIGRESDGALRSWNIIGNRSHGDCCRAAYVR